MSKAIVYSDQLQLFSVGFHLVLLDKPLPYDLYVNFSPDGKSNKFIKIFKAGHVLGAADLKEFKDKYSRLYVLEAQRAQYLASITQSESMKDGEKSEVIKDNAIRYLDEMFHRKGEFTTEVLNDSIEKCHDVVSNMVDVIQGYDVESLQDHIAQLSIHDFYTYDHSINVSMYCISFYRFLKPKAPKSEVTLAGLGGMMHDLGKVSISTSIINNPGQLSEEEFKQMRSHPKYGWDMMHNDQVRLPEGIDLETLARVVYEHHENWDGSGYPNKIKGEKIHQMARVTAICDFFDAITTKRSYSKAMSTGDALALMSKTAGKKLDPTLFQLFAKHVKTAKISVNSFAEIDSDFDPCMPHKNIPLKGFRHKDK